MEANAVKITPESIEAFLNAQLEKGLKKTSVDSYRIHLNRLYRRLPGPEKSIGPSTVQQMLTEMQCEGYSHQTLNGLLTASNQYLDYLGRRDMQITSYYNIPEVSVPELTRAEYRRMLSAARQLNKDREYLMVKVFAVLGINQNDLNLLTVDAVRAGSFVAEQSLVRIPQSLAGELLEYAREHEILSGPLFVGRSGTPLARSRVSLLIAELCDDAKVERAKGNSRNLRKLYQSTMTNLRDNMELLIEQAYDRMLEKEQLTIGWDMSARQKEMRKLDDFAFSERASSL